MADQTLDATLLNCPEPIIRTRKAMKALDTGQTLQVLATDPGAVLDFQAFCRITGNPLLEMSESDGVYRFLIHKLS
jgi:tRNA 2-thiouridine synthesizing protein A